MSGDDNVGQQFHSFDVTTVGKDDLKNGLNPGRHRRVVISDEYDHATASLIAAQLAATTHDEMPVDVKPRI